MNNWLPIPYRVIILGGGLSGLTSAHTILKYSKIPCKVTILEAQSRIGGWCNSTRFGDGTVFEHGPRSARSYGDTALKALNLLSELNLEEDIIGIPNYIDAAKKRYIYAKGKISETPSSISSMFFTQEPFSKPLLASLVKEVFVKKRVGDDESVHSFFKRRFSSEIADYLSDPLCRGIFGGDARELSLQSCFPILFDYERDHGSVLIGAIFSKSSKLGDESALVKRAKSEKWMAWTLKNGIQTLPEKWSAHLKTCGADIHLDTYCSEIEFQSDNKVQCVTNNGIFEAEKVISSLPSCDFAPLLSNQHKKLSELLMSINYANMAVINLEYKSAKLPITGFGILVPSTEPLDVLGITFDSLIIPEHTKSNSTVITVMTGGAWFEELFGHPDSADTDKITELAVKSVRDVLGITETPCKTLCKIQRNCIPQYVVGHEEKAEKIKSYLKNDNLPLTVIGNMWGGVGVNDVILNGRNETLRWLSSNHMY